MKSIIFNFDHLCEFLKIEIYITYKWNILSDNVACKRNIRHFEEFVFKFNQNKDQFVDIRLTK